MDILSFPNSVLMVQDSWLTVFEKIRLRIDEALPATQRFNIIVKKTWPF